MRGSCSTPPHFRRHRPLATAGVPQESAWRVYDLVEDAAPLRLITAPEVARPCPRAESATRAGSGAVGPLGLWPRDCDGWTFTTLPAPGATPCRCRPSARMSIHPADRGACSERLFLADVMCPVLCARARHHPRDGTQRASRRLNPCARADRDQSRRCAGRSGPGCAPWAPCACIRRGTLGMPASCGHHSPDVPVSRKRLPGLSTAELLSRPAISLMPHSWLPRRLWITFPRLRPSLNHLCRGFRPKAMSTTTLNVCRGLAEIMRAISEVTITRIRHRAGGSFGCGRIARCDCVRPGVHPPHNIVPDRWRTPGFWAE